MEETKVEIVTTPAIPVNLPTTGNPGKSTIDTANVYKYIKPSLIRYPTYSYKTGSTMFLSKREQIVVDAYLKTNNESESARALNELYAAHGSWRRVTSDAVHRWLQRQHVASYIADKWIDLGKVNWMDKPKWEAWGVDVMQGVVKATVVQSNVWKEFGKAKGWYSEGNVTNQYNQQINFVQMSGEA